MAKKDWDYYAESSLCATEGGLSMGNLFPAPGGSAPKPPKKHTISIIDHYDDEHYEDPPKKERKPKGNKERDLLIECKGLLNQLKDYKALNGQRTTGTRIKELLQKIEAVLE